MYRNSAQMRSSQYVCDVLSYLNQNQTYKINCEIRRHLISQNLVRTRYNVTFSTYSQKPLQVFENITMIYQDLSNPEVLAARIQKVTNKTIVQTAETIHLNQNMVMLSDLDIYNLSLVKIGSLQQTENSGRLHFVEKNSFYTWPLNMSSTNSEIKSSSFTVRKNLSSPIRILQSVLFLPQSAGFQGRKLQKKKIEKEEHFAYLIDPNRFKLKIEFQKNRRKKNRKLIDKLTKMLRKYAKGSCQRLDVLRRTTGQCAHGDCRLKLRIKFTLSFC